MALIFGMGATEIGLILIIALIVLGPQKLPELALRFGKTLGDLRRATGEFQREFMRAQNDFNEFKDQTVGEVKRGFEFQRPEQWSSGTQPQPRIAPPPGEQHAAVQHGKNGPAFRDPSRESRNAPVPENCEATVPENCEAPVPENCEAPVPQVAEEKPRPTEET